MNYLSIENLSKTWHDKPVLRDVSFGIQMGEKVALVAANGQGKSTLMSIIMGFESPDKGKAILRKEINVGYLPQEPELEGDLTVLENILLEESEISRLVKRYEHLLEQSSSENEAESMAALDQLESATEEMNRLEAWDYEAKVRTVLGKLQIHNHDQKASSLSGGQRKRVALAKVLLSQPDFLIMDEPTNHLDLDMIEWLEGFLNQRDLTLLLVTHDRYFLDRVCDQIVELENGDVFKYKGNYQYYLEKKAEREANLASELEKDRNTYRRELDWVRRMPKARGTKSKSRVEAFDNLEDKIKQQRHKSELNITMRMERLGAKILELHHVKKAFGEVKILNDFSYVFKRKEKVGIIGRNGAGKSTLLNIIMQLETPDSGKVVIGDTIGFGYYSQQGMKIDDSRKVIDEVRDVADWIPMANGNKLTASQLLFQFGFDYDKQFDFVSKLSGGERRRLFLMKILMAAPNFLILDEPTNDLDIQTLSVLEDFLLSYDGCVIIVSHDRFFMDKLVDHCFIFEGEGEVRDFPGNYSDYRDWEELQELSLAKTGQKVNIKLETEIKPDPKELSASVSVESKVETRKLTFKEKFELEQIEKEIPELQQKKSSLLQELSSLTTQYDRIAQLGQEVEALQERLDLLEFRWLELSD